MEGTGTGMGAGTGMGERSAVEVETKGASTEGTGNVTSGAREIGEHAAYNARAVGKILLHPFDKDAKAEAVATARQDKAVSDQKVDAVGAQQAEAL